ncbi:hypothetical protein [Rhizobium sp. Root483D2]|uniref:acyltransferase n=1 Tax=Rhizobium sp. Root483D2 TaxID=1736545 RepID=UPI0007129644|nr:hypothetical protein [Rhizobium sp. Root483D2]KQY49045.1 hypothetical protein ASD32_01780 [Rhizobium sp. Root483D2]
MLIDHGTGNDIRFEGQFLGSGGIHLFGNNNTVIAPPETVLGMNIEIRGSNNTISLAYGAHIADGYALFIADGCNLSIGMGSTIEHAQLWFHETADITIGVDCMLSSAVFASVSDVHSIFDEDGNRINYARSIVIENHVWVGRGVTLLKGTRIGEGAIIGAGSTISGTVEPRTLVVGPPKKVIRRNVHWHRAFLNKIEV